MLGIQTRDRRMVGADESTEYVGYAMLKFVDAIGSRSCSYKESLHYIRFSSILIGCSIFSTNQKA